MWLAAGTNNNKLPFLKNLCLVPLLRDDSERHSVLCQCILG